MKIDIDTRFITLIGTPLRQSFAARMQNAGYDAAGLDLKYFYTEADASHLKEIIGGIRYMPSFAGCAVTKPNKVKVLEYLDELDPLCERMGACNTVVRLPDGRLKGYNTDGAGFRISMETEAALCLSGISAFCVGAGGAGRAICSALADAGAGSILVTDRFEQSARELTEDLKRGFGANAAFIPFGEFGRLKECALVINATGVGMGATRGQSPVPPELLLPGHFCFDACYNPARTQFLLDAEAKGCRVLNGLGMSLYQGVAQLELWTGKKAPVAAMRAELEKIVRENGDGDGPAAEGSEA